MYLRDKKVESLAVRCDFVFLQNPDKNRKLVINLTYEGSPLNADGLRGRLVVIKWLSRYNRMRVRTRILVSLMETEGLPDDLLAYLTTL